MVKPRLATLRPMRRFLMFLLLAWLPLQSSWAAAAVYCVHESNPAQVQHVGHHEHHHGQAATADDRAHDAGSKTGLGGGDFDCGCCHGACSGLLAAPQALTLSLAALPPLRVVTGHVVSGPAERPERPRWASLA